MSAHAITLISLIITIILLLILVSVAINLSLGDNGLFSTAKQAKEEYLNAQTSEEEGLNSLYSEMLVATGDDSKITISVEELEALIEKKVEEKTASLQEKIQNTFCNPKLLTTISLPSPGTTSRAAGTYYAKSTNFTKTNTTDFNDYLSFDSSTGWTVLKSGYYMINSDEAMHVNSNANNVMLINNSAITLNTIAIRSTDYQIDTNNSTFFLEKGTVINFYHYLSASSPWNYSDFLVYALFE